MTYKTVKINFINSWAVDIIRTVYYIHGPELMKLIFAVLYVSKVFFTFIFTVFLQYFMLFLLVTPV